MTSFGVVYRVRKICGVKKAGHTGTLDPEADGVLPVCIGNATKAAGLLTASDKKYVAKIRLGVVTDTQDAQGKVIKTETPAVSAAEFEAAAKSFVGETEQIPPMYSAVKQNGKKLYELARKGIEVERKSRRVNIYSVNIKDFDGVCGHIEVACSKGTYIRTLCHDIGEKLGCGAIMEELTRTASGIFDIENSVSLEDFEKDPEKYAVPVDCMFSEYPKFVADAETEKRIVNGCTVKAEVNAGTVYRVYSEGGRFLCLSEGIGGDAPCLKLKTAFFGG